MIEGADSASFDAGEGIQYGGECEAVSRFVKEACPSFVELKGMTFSGQGCMLTMANCPWYSEVGVGGE